MYEVALTVAACVRADTRVDVAWAVETDGFSANDPGEAVALTPGGGRVGSLLAGSLDPQLADVAAQGSRRGRFVDLSVSDIEAAAFGLSCGGRARCLVMPAAELPDALWGHLLDRDPVCLVTTLDGTDVTGSTLFTTESIAEADEDTRRLFERATSATAVADDTVTTALWPVPSAVIVGGGAIAQALEQAAGFLGWHVRTVADAATATGLVAGLATIDKLIVLSHDLEVAGPVLAAALDSPVGYIGALGSRRTQKDRADWLAFRNITDLTRIHGPAGLDIGANTPPEIAVSIMAEALATAAAAPGGSISRETT